MQLTNEQRKIIAEALRENRKNYDGTDEQYANSWGISNSVFSRIKNGDALDGLLRDNKWWEIASELNVSLKKHKWNIVKTDVYSMIEQEVLFCKQYSKSKICVDSSDIGKTTTARQLSKTLKNCFYVDMSQCPSKIEFIRTMAQTVGINPNDKINNLKKKTKYMLRSLPEAIVMLDEAGDMKYETLLVCKEYWNGTEGDCGWYMIGADALREWIERGKRNKKVGFYEMFNRYGANYTSLTPVDNQERVAFYKKLITDVVRANCTDKTKINQIVNRCLVKSDSGELSGLRRVDSIILLNN